ncbi:MAG: catalase [Labilithrix sp.]|nr:catalase [Labilithrix sp.]MCW5832656.1 catalase [Labilithrix sp.]
MTTKRGHNARRPETARLSKDEDLEKSRKRCDRATLTTDQGVPIPHTDDSLKVGARGPTLLEDFHLREKVTRFDHERIPERVVHARGSGAHGVFRLHESLSDLTTAELFCDTSLETPVFVRFSTVQGARGSADTVRDVRGFATKFYTRQGNFDLVGNNMPVFFVQDGIKFPDFVHAVKPEPQHEMPGGASAHDSFWDFCGLVPESAHMVMWLMSDRAIPRSFANMEGFGVHTFRLIDAKGRSHLVKFHWKPVLGVHSLAWDEAQKIAGKDADFNRRDLWESIEAGLFFEYDLGVQLVDEQTAADIGVDLLDVTKIVPEEIAPVRRVGRMTLDRNPDNFFAETEQVAFCVQNVVPGIGFTDDPMMTARLFSYLDTQLTRLGGPNHAQLPINRPLAPVHNHQQDGFGNQQVPVTVANYFPNSLGGGCPFLAKTGGYVDFPEVVEGKKTRERSPSFADHFTQAAMFFHSMSAPEKEHIVSAYSFELSKVVRREVRERYVNEILANVDAELAASVASAVGVRLAAKGAPTPPKLTSPALSMESSTKGSVRGRRVAVLAAPGVDDGQVDAVFAALSNGGARPEIVSTALGPVGSREATKTLFNTSSVLWDAVYVPGGAKSVEALRARADARTFIREAFGHAKPIGGTGEGAELVLAAIAEDVRPGAAGPEASLPGVVLARDSQTATFPTAFVEAVARHRFWSRTASGS